MGADPNPASDRAQALSRGGRALSQVSSDLAARYPERDTLIAQAVLAVIAREHLVIFGPPGTGKSEIAAAFLRRFVDDQGRPSLYARQIVETTVQSDLVGPVDFKVLTETGKTVHRIEEGILASEFAILDEAFDGRDLLLRSILCVLNERELALGNQVVKARLASAFLTTNQYLSDLLAARPETLLAFCDRIAFCSFVPKEFARTASRNQLLENAAGRARPDSEARVSLSDLACLQAAALEVEVPPGVLSALSAVVDEFETRRAESLAEHKGYVAIVYLSPRTLAKAVGVLRAAVIRDRWVNGIDRQLRVDVADLGNLSAMFVPGGPSAQDLSRLAQRSRDRRERAQLEGVAAERQAFQTAFEHVAEQMRRVLREEEDRSGLPALRRLAREGPPRAMEVVLAAENALERVRSPQLRGEIFAVAHDAAAAWAEATGRGHIVDPPTSDPVQRVSALRATARVLVASEKTRSHARLAARDGVSAAAEALSSITTRYTVEELEGAADDHLQDVTPRVERIDAQIRTLLDMGRELSAMARAGDADLADWPKRQNGSFVGEAADLERLASAARKSAAAALRRRATGAAQRALADLPEVDPWRPVAYTARLLSQVDQAVARLAPEEATARTSALRTGCAQIAAREIASWPAVRLEELAAIVDRLADRMSELGVSPSTVFDGAGAHLQKKLEWWMRNRALAGKPEAGPASEDGYLRLLEHCRGAQDRRSLARLVAALGAQPGLTHLDGVLARTDLEELREQVGYLTHWFGQVTSSVPSPSEIISAEEADAAWKLVSSSRFFTVGWRDNDLAALRERLGSYRSSSELGALASEALRQLEDLAERARLFGQALLERRAELAA